VRELILLVDENIKNAKTAFIMFLRHQILKLMPNDFN
jgi:hypothetical protein